jgi:hypothetical protein
MNPVFFVTGFARSRTAWLANLLTYGPSYCHHDALRLGTTPEFLEKMFTDTWWHNEDVEYVGDSDSGLLAIAPKVLKAFPDSRWVLIERPMEEAARSYFNAFKDTPYPQTPVMSLEQVRALYLCISDWKDAFKKIVPGHLLMVVPFDRLGDEAVVASIWTWCVPAIPFNYERFRMLNSFSVNIIPGKVEVMGDAAKRWAEVMA